MTRTALVVRGGWQGHHPIEASQLFVPFLRDQGFNVLLESSPQVYADASVMTQVDLIVQSITMSEISTLALDGLSLAIRQGTGFTGWHGGIADSFRNSSGYLHLVGGQFATHPSTAPDLAADDEERNYLSHTIEFTKLGHEHAITEGLENGE